MPELSVAPDPAFWSLVPARAEAEPWLRALADGREPEQVQTIVMAAELALQAAEHAPEGVVLLLSEPQSRLYAALTILVTAAPAAETPARAAELALTVTPSPWTPTVVPFELNDAPGWRVSILLGGPSEAAGGPEGGATAAPATALSQTVTTYVFAVAGRLAVAQLSPLPPTAAGVALALTEQLLPTIEVSAID